MVANMKTEIKITEKQFSSQVEDLFDLYQWTWTHFRPGMMQSGRWVTPLSGFKGFPDYCAVKKDKLIFLELKSDKGKTSPSQKIWLSKLKDAGCDVYVFKPSDFEKIVEVLNAL